ncbi:hypothetical protein D0863_04914 [Hortaea werneckii]|uniref:WSC domain-containing protein n=1 Tax=Hortaea werneckii TaxID=91943 RepID=A0A3M7E623_HORWE|nr:hypothetical protein D0863_04914 [Hortaea werneckii]
MSTMSMRTAALTLATLFSAPSEAFWRMPCPGRLVQERIDPIVDPGEVSGHVHTVSGGSGFGFETSFEQQRQSACSSCPVKPDLSVYWTPKLYFMDQDGHFEDVPQAGEGEGVTGGMTVYYEQRGGPDNDKLKAFPPGFRMLAGESSARNATDAEAAPGRAVSYACLDYTGPAREQTENMPDYNCPNGLRAQIFFPSCWDGVHNDTEDHKSHMAYPIGRYDNGRCPDSHPHHLISIFYEVIYQTNLFADRWWGDQQPFVFAQGDRTGYGFHGDFVNGWEVDVLQDAVDNCLSDSGNIADCPVFANDLFTDEECQACRLPTQIDEQTTGNLTSLPGCNPPTSSSDEDVAPSSCSTPAISSPTQYFSNMIPSVGWEYQGCASDDIASRTLTGGFTWSDDMTVQHCIDYCKGEGFSLAGLEYANQCYCGNDYANQDAAPNPDILGNCWQPCAGNDQEVCGGSAALSVYKSCDDGACSNAVFHVNGTDSASSSSSAGGSSEKRKRHIHKHAHGHAKFH